jgi:PAS domain S-box-containing protein
MPARPLRLLLVEDNAGDARLVREYLREAEGDRVSVEVAGTLKAAVARLNASAFDAVLLDLSLPDSQGLATLAAVRAQAPQLPTIALTGLDDEATALRALEGGAQDYIAKRSLSGESLARAVRYAISRSELLRALEVNALALAAQEERYRTLVDGLDAIVWEADLDRVRFTFVSHRVETLLGYPVSDLVDQDDFWQLHVHPHDFERELERRNAEPGSMENHVAEYRIKASDGRWVWVRDVVRVARDSEGRPAHLSGVMIDMSEAVAVQQYRENLIDVISHEFRTPVTVIQGYSQLITDAKGKLSADQLATARARISSASEHLAYLLGSITELSRLRGGESPLRREAVASRDLIKEAVAALGAKGRSIEGAVKVRVARGAERLNADRRKTVIALVELLDNAAKFSPPGEPIWVEARAEGDWVMLTVEDKGPGIADEMRDSLFKPFVQADMTSVRATGGAGLGLAVVTGLVQAQGGRVELDSVVGEGSAFHILLPRAIAPHLHAPPSGKPQGAERGANGRAGK